MKSDLGFHPIYPSKDKQIEAHLFLSILAFHVVHLIRSKLGAKQIHKNNTQRSKAKRQKKEDAEV